MTYGEGLNIYSAFSIEQTLFKVRDSIYYTLRCTEDALAVNILTSDHAKCTIGLGVRHLPKRTYI